MKSFISSALLLTLALFDIGGQHLIGFDKQTVKNIVRKEMKSFSIDNAAVNQSFNYLKFINSSGTKTLIVFFNDNDMSTNVRLVCDYSEFDFVKSEFNGIYENTGKSMWEYTADNTTYMVTLEEKEWYFVVYTKKKPESTEPSKKTWLWKLLN